MRKLGTVPGAGGVPVPDPDKGDLPEADLEFARTQPLMGAPDIIYEPTASINPADPRTSRVEYYKAAKVMKVYWGDGGTPYQYYDVTLSQMKSMMDVKSPGRKIRRVFDNHVYGPVEG